MADQIETTIVSGLKPPFDMLKEIVSVPLPNGSYVVGWCFTAKTRDDAVRSLMLMLDVLQEVVHEP